MRSQRALIPVLFLFLIAAACSRKAPEGGGLHLVIKDSRASGGNSALDIGTAPAPIMRVMVNISGEGIPAGAPLFNYWQMREGLTPRTQVDVPFPSVPRGAKLIQALIVLAGEGDGIGAFKYGEVPLTITGGDQAVTIETSQFAGMMGQGRIAGRIMDATGHGPTGKVSMYYKPGNSPRMLLDDQQEIFDGWFSVFALDGAGFTYVGPDGRDIFAPVLGAVTGDNVVSVGETRLLGTGSDKARTVRVSTPQMYRPNDWSCLASSCSWGLRQASRLVLGFFGPGAAGKQVCYNSNSAPVSGAYASIGTSAAPIMWSPLSSGSAAARLDVVNGETGGSPVPLAFDANNPWNRPECSLSNKVRFRDYLSLHEAELSSLDSIAGFNGPFQVIYGSNGREVLSRSMANDTLTFKWRFLPGVEASSTNTKGVSGVDVFMRTENADLIRNGGRNEDYRGNQDIADCANLESLYRFSKMGFVVTSPGTSPDPSGNAFWVSRTGFSSLPSDMQSAYIGGFVTAVACPYNLDAGKKTYFQAAAVSYPYDALRNTWYQMALSDDQNPPFQTSNYSQSLGSCKKYSLTLFQNSNGAPTESPAPLAGALNIYFGGAPAGLYSDAACQTIVALPLAWPSGRSKTDIYVKAPGVDSSASLSIGPMFPFNVNANSSTLTFGSGGAIGISQFQFAISDANQNFSATYSQGVSACQKYTVHLLQSNQGNWQSSPAPVSGSVGLWVSGAPASLWLDGSCSQPVPGPLPWAQGQSSLDVYVRSDVDAAGNFGLSSAFMSFYPSFSQSSIAFGAGAVVPLRIALSDDQNPPFSVWTYAQEAGSCKRFTLTMMQDSGMGSQPVAAPSGGVVYFDMANPDVTYWSDSNCSSNAIPSMSMNWDPGVSSMDVYVKAPNTSAFAVFNVFPDFGANPVFYLGSYVFFTGAATGSADYRMLLSDGISSPFNQTGYIQDVSTCKKYVVNLFDVAQYPALPVSLAQSGSIYVYPPADATLWRDSTCSSNPFDSSSHLDWNPGNYALEFYLRAPASSFGAMSDLLMVDADFSGAGLTVQGSVLNLSFRGSGSGSGSNSISDLEFKPDVPGALVLVAGQCTPVSVRAYAGGVPTVVSGPVSHLPLPPGDYFYASDCSGDRLPGEFVFPRGTDSMYLFYRPAGSVAYFGWKHLNNSDQLFAFPVESVARTRFAVILSDLGDSSNHSEWVFHHSGDLGAWWSPATCSQVALQPVTTSGGWIADSLVPAQTVNLSVDSGMFFSDPGCSNALGNSASFDYKNASTPLYYRSSSLSAHFSDNSTFYDDPAIKWNYTMYFRPARVDVQATASTVCPDCRVGLSVSLRNALGEPYTPPIPLRMDLELAARDGLMAFELLPSGQSCNGQPQLLMDFQPGESLKVASICSLTDTGYEVVLARLNTWVANSYSVNAAPGTSGQYVGRLFIGPHQVPPMNGYPTPVFPIKPEICESVAGIPVDAQGRWVMSGYDPNAASYFATDNTVNISLFDAIGCSAGNVITSPIPSTGFAPAMFRLMIHSANDPVFVLREWNSTISSPMTVIPVQTYDGL